MHIKNYQIPAVFLWAVLLMTAGHLGHTWAQAQCPLDKRLGKISGDGEYFLPKNYTFKVKFDSAIGTDLYKTGSIVQFTVAENVYGVKLPAMSKEERNKLRSAADSADAAALEKMFENNDSVVVIAKDSKGYGKIERAKRQLPLFLNYKARISVVLDYVLLANGDCIPIEITVSPDARLYDAGDTDVGNVIDCKSGNLSGKKCIKGRRPRFNFVSPIISGGAAVATVLVKDPTARALAGVTAVDQLSKNDLGNIINGADSQISEKLIYEVITTENRTGTIPKPPK